MEILPAVQEIIGEIDLDPDALHAKYLSERDKRLEFGDRTYIKIRDDFSHYAEDPHSDPNFTREPVFDEVQFLLIGAGFGSLVMGARLREAGYRSLRIVDTAGDVGGTWYWNRYPGAACDTEGYVYVPLLEETGAMLSSKYAFQPEILARPTASPTSTTCGRMRCSRPPLLGCSGKRRPSSGWSALIAVIVSRPST
jgi:cyclohexanone monooxygenase